MSITLEYTGKQQKFKDACDVANKILSSDKFYTMIASRSTPYQESVPSDLLPERIAEFFRGTDLKLTLKQYKASRTIGGVFKWSQPLVIWININSNRSGCTYAAVLIHECVHALSFHTENYSFTHDKDSPSKNNDTAPYAIQKNVRELFCDERSFIHNDLILVELETDNDN